MSELVTMPCPVCGDEVSVSGRVFVSGPSTAPYPLFVWESESQIHMDTHSSTESPVHLVALIAALAELTASGLPSPMPPEQEMVGW